VAGPIVPPAREGRRRGFNEADKRQTLKEAVQAGVSEEARRYGIAARVLFVNFRLMDIDLAALPDNVETPQRIVRMLAIERANLTEAQAEIERLRLIVQKLQRSKFDRRAERLDDDQLQFRFERPPRRYRAGRSHLHQRRSGRRDLAIKRVRCLP
jgi:transposase-like protein